eukprot:jgi/Chlat1/1020/Chrsp109S01448
MRRGGTRIGWCWADEMKGEGREIRPYTPPLLCLWHPQGDVHSPHTPSWTSAAAAEICASAARDANQQRYNQAVLKVYDDEGRKMLTEGTVESLLERSLGCEHHPLLVRGPEELRTLELMHTSGAVRKYSSRSQSQFAACLNATGYVGNEVPGLGVTPDLIAIANDVNKVHALVPGTTEQLAGLTRTVNLAFGVDGQDVAKFHGLLLLDIAEEVHPALGKGFVLMVSDEERNEGWYLELLRFLLRVEDLKKQLRLPP